MQQANARRDPRSLTSLPEILSSISTFQSEEAELSNSLTELLSAREPIVSSLSRLHSLVPCLDDLHREASFLSQKVSTTALTAERVGGRVRSLDEKMRRIREAGDRVGQVIELKVILYIFLSPSLERTFLCLSVISRSPSSVYRQSRLGRCN